MLADSPHRFGVDLLKFQNDFGPAERIDFPRRAQRVWGIPRLLGCRGLFYVIPRVLGWHGRIGVPRSKEGDRCLAHKSSSRWLSKECLARSALLERSPDGLIGLGWIWYFHRCRSCDGARRWRDANRFVLLSDGRVSLPGEFGCRVASRLDRHRNGIAIPIAIGKVDRFALSQEDHVTRVERRCRYCV